MNKKIFVCCGLILLSVVILMKGHFLLKPIAKVGNDTVRMYEFIGYSISNEQHVLERMADDIAFKKLIEETGVTVTEEEVQRELDKIEKPKLI